MTTLKVLRHNADGVTYADPADPNLTVRLRSSSATKSLNSIPVSNYVTEIIYNDDNPITVSAVNAQDAVSVRLRTSATKESAVRLKEILLSMAAQVGTWSDQGVFVGFEPSTAPVIPAV
jgi:hypothetical protein